MSLQPALVIGILFLLGISSLANAEILTIDASAEPTHSDAGVFHMGTSRSPDGHEITVDSISLLRDGKRWLPVMGEFHYSRYPQSEWRDELLKMKAGGIEIVSSYVFWIHHEEVQGKWDWSGQRDLRAFVATCQDAGLPLILRIGPWDHGEVRNGGFPDWLVDSGARTRSDDPAYIEEVRALYGQIATQLQGMLWKDGGPVIGIQVENEFRGPAEHLLNLKNIAREVGIDVPIYTRTGWPALKEPMPFGQLLPLFGAYAEGFWDRSLDSMPGRYWQAFTFRAQRTDTAIATDQLGQHQSPSEIDARQYPYLTCELGGGMMSSYHRRIHIDPMDVLAIAICKIGSGSNLPGYYMYHGGTNPDSETGITLQESQATKATNYNDMPVKNYDFQAPLGAFGQVRESYHLLRRLHLFLNDWGSELAPMWPVFPSTTTEGKDDTNTLRWSVRTNGTGGFLFVNNYQRGLPLPGRTDVQFEVKLSGQTLRIPGRPVTIPADSAFLLPFNLDLCGEKLIYATAQPICRVDNEDDTYVAFAQIPGMPSEFAFEDGIHVVKPGVESQLRIETKSKRHLNILVLDEQDALRCWKGDVYGAKCIVLSSANVEFDSHGVWVLNDNPHTFNIQCLPVDGLRANGHGAIVKENAKEMVAIEQINAAGLPREIKMGSQKVAAAPSDEDFDRAGSWRIKLPNAVSSDRHFLLRIHYTGDVARLYLNGKLIADDFNNGDPMEIGLDRFAPDISKYELLLRILPLQKGAPIFLPKAAQPDFGDRQSIAAVKSVELIEQYKASVTH